MYCSLSGEILTASLETLQALGTLARDVRGSPAGLQLRLGALQTTPALVIGVLTTLTTAGGWRTLNRPSQYLLQAEHFISSPSIMFILIIDQ